MGSSSGPPAPGPAAGVMPAARVAVADRVMGVFQSGAPDATADAAEPVTAAAVSVTAPSGAASSVASVPEDTAACTAVAGDAAGCWGPAGASAAGFPGCAGASAGAWVGRSSPVGSGLPPPRTGRHTRPQSSAGVSVPGVVAGDGSGESAPAGPAGKRMAMARTNAAAVVDTTRRAGKVGVIATFRCAQSPTAAFLVSPAVFYSRTRGRKSALCPGLCPGGRAPAVRQVSVRADAVPAPPGERSPAGAHQEHSGGDGREVGAVGLRALPGDSGCLGGFRGPGDGRVPV